MLEVAGLGPKRGQTIYQELGVTSLAELKEAAERGQIQKPHRLDEKSEQRILEDLERRDEEEEERTERANGGYHPAQGHRGGYRGGRLAGSAG